MCWSRMVIFFPSLSDIELNRGTENRTFKTSTIRLARLSVNSFLENVDLVVRTLGEFGEDAERSSTT